MLKDSLAAWLEHFNTLGAPNPCAGFFLAIPKKTRSQTGPSYPEEWIMPHGLHQPINEKGLSCSLTELHDAFLLLIITR